MYGVVSLVDDGDGSLDGAITFCWSTVSTGSCSRLDLGHLAGIATTESERSKAHFSFQFLLSLCFFLYFCYFPTFSQSDRLLAAE